MSCCYLPFRERRRVVEHVLREEDPRCPDDAADLHDRSLAGPGGGSGGCVRAVLLDGEVERRAVAVSERRRDVES